MKHRHGRRQRTQQLGLSPSEEMQREFRERFGRDMRPEDPVFWSSERSGAEPVPMTEEEIEQTIWRLMESTGLDPTKVRINEHMRFKPVP